MPVPYVPPVPFPQAPLRLAADLLLGGTWTALRDAGGSSYVMQRAGDQIPAITRGRAPEALTPVPCTFTAQLNNRDYRFSLHNPAGPWYGLLGRNTPIRVSVPAAAAYLRLEDDAASYCSAPSAAGLNVPGDLDVRVDCELTNWSASVLASKWAAGQQSWAFLLNADGSLALWFSLDGTSVEQMQSTRSAGGSTPLPWPGGRITLRVTYTASTGAISFYYSTSIAGPWTQIGATFVLGGVSGALYAGSAPLAIGANTYFAGLPGYLGTIAAGPGAAWSPAAFQGIQGAVYEMQVYAGIGGTLVADPVFTAQSDTTTTFADAQGNPWALAGSAECSTRAYRIHAEVSEWPVRSDETGADVYVTLTASGMLRRLQQKAAPLGSAMTRAWQRVTGIYAPHAYWPCEDGNNTQVVTLGLSSTSSSTPAQIASGLPGGGAMSLGNPGITKFASNSDFTCSNALPVAATDTWSGAVAGYPVPASSPACVVRFLLSIPAGGETDGVILARFYSTGTVAQVDAEYHSGGALSLTGYSAAGAQLFTSGDVAFGQDGKPCLCELAVTQNGTGITWHINTLDVGAQSQLGLSGNVSSATVGAVTGVVVNPAGGTVQSAIGQISVQSSYAEMDSATSADALVGPLNAWAFETAGLRFARLCGEQGYPCRITGYPAASVPMGPQTPQTFMQLLQECENADHGVIAEPRTALALGYRCSMSLCAQQYAVADTLPLVLTYPSAHLGISAGGPGLEATDDDQLTVNDEIVTRGAGNITGSSFEATLTGAQYAAGSALSIAAPPAGAGLYQDAQTVNVATDGQLGDQAGWLVHTGTVNEPRYSLVPLNLARPELAALAGQVAALDVGDYFQITGPPPWLSPDTIKALLWGYTEQLGGFVWTITASSRPESPWEILIAA